jgi:hypothetical protein
LGRDLLVLLLGLLEHAHHLLVDLFAQLLLLPGHLQQKRTSRVERDGGVGTRVGHLLKVAEHITVSNASVASSQSPTDA